MIFVLALAHHMSAPDPTFLEPPGRDLPQRTSAVASMTETIPSKKQNGLPPGLVRPETWGQRRQAGLFVAGRS